MNYTKYQELRNENIQLFLGDNPKFKGILELDEAALKTTMLAAAESIVSHPNKTGFDFTYRETLQLIAFCAAELARIS